MKASLKWDGHLGLKPWVIGIVDYHRRGGGGRWTGWVDADGAGLFAK